MCDGEGLRGAGLAPPLLLLLAAIARVVTGDVDDGELAVMVEDTDMLRHLLLSSALSLSIDAEVVVSALGDRDGRWWLRLSSATASREADGATPVSEKAGLLQDR